jgi:hypothetical protein
MDVAGSGNGVDLGARAKTLDAGVTPTRRAHGTTAPPATSGRAAVARSSMRGTPGQRRERQSGHLFRGEESLPLGQAARPTCATLGDGALPASAAPAERRQSHVPLLRLGVVCAEGEVVLLCDVIRTVAKTPTPSAGVPTNWDQSENLTLGRRQPTRAHTLHATWVIWG